jgi:hypothetical protein
MAGQSALHWLYETLDCEMRTVMVLHWLYEILDCETRTVMALDP